jgi:hypothetical protein
MVANFLFGKVEETRLFLELAIVLIPATFIVLFRIDAKTGGATDGPTPRSP